MIEKVLPPAVATAESTTDVDEAHLFPEEEAFIARAVAKRRREFTTGRWCARRAMADLGIAPRPVPRGDRGMPVWPEGVLGSITHCTRFRAAAAVRSEHLLDVLGIGIDAEPHEPLPDGVFEVITAEHERARLHDLSAVDSSVHWGRLLFSAKEAIFKAWYPATHRWIDFAEAEITFHWGSFAAHVPRRPASTEPSTRLEGRWLVEGDLVVTALLLGRTALAGRPGDSP